MTGRDHVGLRERVVPRRPARRVLRHQVVGPPRGVLRAHRADGDGRRRVAGRRDAGVAGLAGDRVAADVAGRDHDDDAGAHGRLDRLHQRVGGRRLVDRVAERQVDDVDRLRDAVVDGPLDRADHVAGGALAVLVQHAQADQLDVLGDARHLRRAAADGAGDVRAVAIRVHARPAGAAGEVHEADDAAAEVGRPEDARVDHRHRDARAVERAVRGRLVDAERPAQREGRS